MRYVPVSMLFWCMAICLLIGFIFGKLDIKIELRDELKGVKYVAPGNQ